MSAKLMDSELKSEKVDFTSIDQHFYFSILWLQENYVVFMLQLILYSINNCTCFLTLGTGRQVLEGQQTGAEGKDSDREVVV